MLSNVSDDPMKLRALAHPLRWKLIDLIGAEQTATATRCAEVLGESVASCSYHLSILAKYGYIELVPGQTGKEKPWRLTSYEQNLAPAGPETEWALAAEAASGAFLDHELARMKDRLRRRSLEPAEWQDASSMLGVSTYMTADELEAAAGELSAVVARYEGRASDPESRPAGSRLVRLFYATSVEPPAVLPKTRPGAE
jgi:Helix-turn-helix domain